MPLYMDIHTIEGVTAEALAQAHAADVKVQDQFGVEYIKYWVNEGCGKVFCLVHAPTPEAATAVHRDAHGFVAEKIIEVDPEIRWVSRRYQRECGRRGHRAGRPGQPARLRNAKRHVHRHRRLDRVDPADRRRGRDERTAHA